MFRSTSENSNEPMQQWTVERFLSHPVPNGKFFKSKPFSVRERTFRLVVYPNGDVEESQGIVSLYLLCETDHFEAEHEKRLLVEIRLGILNQRNRKFAKPPITVSMEDLATNIYGYSEFIQRTSLNDSLLPMGNLTVYCQLVFHS